MKSKAYWNRKFINMNIDWEDWLSHFFDRYIPTHVKTLNGKYSMDMSIQKLVWRMTFSDGLCKLCHAGPENLDHLIYKCDKVWIFWINELAIIRNCVVLDYIMMDFPKVAYMSTHMKEREIINVMLTICRWSIWKGRDVNLTTKR